MENPLPHAHYILVRREVYVKSTDTDDGVILHSFSLHSISFGGLMVIQAQHICQSKLVGDLKASNVYNLEQTKKSLWAMYRHHIRQCNFFYQTRPMIRTIGVSSILGL